MDGFLNLNKPFGLTSHDCVARVRRLLQMKRVGHGGTLDPAATGVLPIALGRATRLLQYLSHDKAYRATVRFGVRTATDDLEGEILASTPCPDLSLTDVEAVLPQFLGRIQQIPPSYSAIQVGGKRLYDLARSGEPVEAPVRTVDVYGIEILEWRSGEYPELDVAIACGTGTYIRAIARDWGENLQTGGTLAKLERTMSSGFELVESISLEELAVQSESGGATLQGKGFANAPEALRHLRSVVLAADVARRWGQGQKIGDEGFQEAGVYRVMHDDGTFLGIGEIEPIKAQLVPKMVF
jgi:tRNA pseudouridine55 synthase